eukprot:79938_1
MAASFLVTFCVLAFHGDAIIVTRDYHENTVAGKWDPNNGDKIPIDALHCNFKEDCIVNCYGTLACYNTVIVGPEDARLTVNCHSDKYQDTDEGLACQGIYINATLSTELILNVANEAGELSLATIYAPEHDHFLPNTFILCGLLGAFNVNKVPKPNAMVVVCGAQNLIYSIYGFKAVSWTYFASNTWALHQCGEEVSCGGLQPNQMICGANFKHSDCTPFAETVYGRFDCENQGDICYYGATYPPTNKPTPSPTAKPTDNPSTVPSVQPSKGPSDHPTGQPSNGPSVQPSKGPSDQPTDQPSKGPSVQPSNAPSDQPSVSPSALPTQASLNLSDEPSSSPTRTTTNPTPSPTLKPTSSPTPEPSPNTTITPTKATTSSPAVDPTAAPTEDDMCNEDMSLDRSDCDESEDEPSNECSALITMSFAVCYVEPYEEERLALWTNAKHCVCSDVYGGSTYADDDKDKNCYVEEYESTAMTDMYVEYDAQSSDHSACEAQHTFEISVALYNGDCDYVHEVARWLLDQGDEAVLTIDECNLDLSTKRNYLYPAGFGRIMDAEVKIKFRDENGDSQEVENVACLKSVSRVVLMMYCIVWMAYFV